MHLGAGDDQVKEKASWIQAACLFGWAIGGAVFGLIGDWIGRSRALILTILTYAGFTGLSYFAQSWEQLLVFRFLAALGIGGEWAVGAALLSETWPKTWRPWIAAVLQTGVNIGAMLAAFAAYVLSGYEHRVVFLVGLLPALLTLWIRYAVPETEAWHEAKTKAKENKEKQPSGILDLFRGSVLRITLLTLSVCGMGLTAHWAFMFWCSQHLRNLPEMKALSPAELTGVVSFAMFVVLLSSIIGNFTSAILSIRFGYRKAIVVMFLAYGVMMMWCYSVPRTMSEMWPFLISIGVCQGVFSIFTMYLPPLFPVLIRTTGAGFCYNFGRIAAATGVILFAIIENYTTALLMAGSLFIIASLLSLFLPDRTDE